MVTTPAPLGARIGSVQSAGHHDRGRRTLSTACSITDDHLRVWNLGAYNRVPQAKESDRQVTLTNIERCGLT